MGDRLAYVDGFRGLALFTMVTIQIFDAVAVSSIYTTPPYYVEMINSVTWFPPSFLFTFVTGMSAWLLMRSRQKRGLAGLDLVMAVVKKYGKYVALSLPFSIIVFDLEIFLRWNEAIQGIGTGAIVITLLYVGFSRFLTIDSRKGWMLLAAIVIVGGIAQGRLHDMAIGLPANPTDAATILTGLQAFLANILWRGWFSLVNLIPIMAGGTLFFHLLRNKDVKTTTGIGLAAMVIVAILHTQIIPVDYYGRSITMTYFAVAECFIIFSGIYMLYKRDIAGRVCHWLSIFGKTAFVVYVGHYLTIIKPLWASGYADLLPDWQAWLLTVPLTAVVGLGAKQYLAYRENLPSWLQF